MWPKLSETLPYHHPGRCQNCNLPSGGACFGIVVNGDQLTCWQECDDQDQPTVVFVVLCKPCADKIIEPHPRLYREQAMLTPLPGVMPICADCPFQLGLRCVSPQAGFNGGPGLEYEPKGSNVHLCRSPRRLSGWHYILPGPVTKCSGKEAQS